VVRSLRPVLEEIASQYGGRVLVVTLDVDDKPRTARRYNILSMPTMNVYQHGQLVRSVIGARPKARLLEDLRDIF
jgi:thioredoxin 1